MSKSVCFDGIGNLEASFLVEDAVVGQVVTMAGAQTVEGCAEDDLFCGVLTGLSGDGVGAVQVGGFATVIADSTVAVGYVMLAADGAGGVTKVTSGGRVHLVVDVDATAGTAVILL